MINENELSVSEAFYSLLDPSNRNPESKVLPNINSQDENGLTALHYAIAKLNSSPKDKIAINIKDVIKFLLQDPNLDPNIQDEHGMTALHYAVSQNNKDIVVLLLSNSSFSSIIHQEDIYH